MAILITSQDFISDEIVANKVAESDFQVFVSPVFEIDGREYQVILDGHHSLAAAEIAGVDPDIHEMDRRDHDAICLLDAGDIEGFLEVVHMGVDYFDVRTGLTAF